MSTLTLTTKNFGTAVEKLYKRVQRSGKIIVSVKEVLAQKNETPNADFARYLHSEEFKNDKSKPVKIEELLAELAQYKNPA